MRPSAASRPADPAEARVRARARAAFADDVAYYLTLSPRQLPSRYLYDELGSSLFEAICRLPWYRITRIEQRLLSTHGPSIVRLLPRLDTIVELGPGSGDKLATLLAAAGNPPMGEALTVHLVDISHAALAKATAALAESGSTVVAHEATYEDGLARALAGADRPADTQALVAFLGSNIGNFDPPGVSAFLRGLRASLRTGDALLLGTDLVKPEEELLLAYDDPLGVTSAFNRNLLVRVNRELDGDFDVNGFGHRAVWNADESRIEMHLVSVGRQQVRVGAIDLEIGFDEGESIWTESSYKYRPEDLAPVLARARFDVAGQWIEDRFALTLAVCT
jgi:dimethylhistidine N-methyltransferase